MRIMSRLETLRVSGPMIFLAVAGPVLAAPGAVNGDGGGYLAIVGPPALRFASSGRHGNIVPTQYCLAESSPVKIAMPSPSAEKTSNPAMNLPSPANATPVASAAAKADAAPSSASLPAPIFMSSGVDPSIVTPAMLVDYLKPSTFRKNTSGNNDQSPAVPVNLGFTPPTAPAQNVSRAVYKNE